MLIRIEIVFFVLFCCFGQAIILGMNNNAVLFKKISKELAETIRQQNLKFASEEAKIASEKAKILEKKKMSLSPPPEFLRVKLQELKDQLYQELQSLKNVDNQIKLIPRGKVKLIKGLLKAINLPCYNDYLDENKKFLEKIRVDFCQLDMWQDENRLKIEKFSLLLSSLLMRKQIDTLPLAIEWRAEKNTQTIFSQPIAKHQVQKQKSDLILDAIKTALIALKERNDQDLCVIDKDILNIEFLWDQYKLEYNHTWLDCVLHPFRESADSGKLQKIVRKKFALLSHEDKYSLQNREPIKKLFQYLYDTSKPPTTLDSVVNKTFPMVSSIFIGEVNSLGICFLNKILPRLFLNRKFEEKISFVDKQINLLQKETQLTKVTLETKQKLARFKKENLRDNVRDLIKKSNRSHTK